MGLQNLRSWFDSTCPCQIKKSDVNVRLFYLQSCVVLSHDLRIAPAIREDRGAITRSNENKLPLSLFLCDVVISRYSTCTCQVELTLQKAINSYGFFNFNSSFLPESSVRTESIKINLLVLDYKVVYLYNSYVWPKF